MPWPLCLGDGDCGCDTGCDITSDTFDEPLSSEDWRQVTGTWDNESDVEVAGDVLYTTDADASIRNLNEHPDDEPWFHASVQVKAFSQDDQLRLAGIWIADDDYVAVEITFSAFNGSGLGTLRIIHVSGATVTELATEPLAGVFAGRWYTLTLCYRQEESGEHRLFASLSGNPQAVKVEVADYPSYGVADADGYGGGLATGDLTTKARFNNFVYNKAKSDTNPDCLECSLLICDHCTTRLPDLAIINSAGVIDGTCTNCEVFSDTFYLPKSAFCGWALDEQEPSPCPSGYFEPTFGWGVTFHSGNLPTPTDCDPDYARVTAYAVIGSVVVAAWESECYGPFPLDCETVLKSQVWTLTKYYESGGGCDFPDTITVEFDD